MGYTKILTREDDSDVVKSGLKIELRYLIRKVAKVIQVFLLVEMNDTSANEIDHLLTVFYSPQSMIFGDDIEETLEKRQAKYHRSCHISLNNTNLERAEKRYSCAAPSEGRSKFARSSLDNRVYVCFICEKVQHLK